MKGAAGMVLAIHLSFLCFLSSCSSLPSGKSWSTVSVKQRGTVELGTVRVDKNADWDSVEAEARRFLPLRLAEQGYLYSTAEENRYRVEAVLIEREYMENWKTRRSLSAEVMVWKQGESLLPLTAGKVVVSGSTKTLSSSKVLHKLLSSALSRALWGLPKK